MDQSYSSDTAGPARPSKERQALVYSQDYPLSFNVSHQEKVGLI